MAAASPAPLPAWPGPGLWIVATLALGRPVRLADTYPHICGTRATSPATGATVRLAPRDCGACPAPDRTVP